MVNFIIISHGKLAEGLLNASQMIIGPQEKVRTLSLTPDQSIDTFKTELTALLDEIDNGEETLILADLFGGTPANTAASLTADKENTEVITGINLPILIELLSSRKNGNLSELVSKWQASKGTGMKLISEVLNQ
jgi:PTS system mannose-specific IIA component